MNAAQTGTTLAVNGGLIGVAVAVSMGLVQIVKPTIDEFLSPMKGVHDTLVEGLAVFFSLLIVGWGTWAYTGFNNRADVYVVFINTVTAVLSEFGLYAKIRGPVPVTPTAAYIAKLNEVGVQRRLFPPPARVSEAQSRPVAKVSGAIDGKGVETTPPDKG